MQVKIITKEDVSSLFKNNADDLFKIVEDSFLKFSRGDVLCPDKITQVFDSKTQNRINCMPATLLCDKVSGLKWVSVFPSNSLRGVKNVTGIMLLSEINTGFPIAIIDGTFCTLLRTAAVGCVAAKYLAPRSVKTIGFIGAGEEAKMHFALLKHMFPSISICKVSSRKPASELNFISTFRDILPNVSFVACNGDSSQTVCDADIIVTAISGQSPILKAADIKKGSLYIHVGGWEDEYGVALKADKIICDDWQATKHRSQTICRMYKEGLLQDSSIYANLYEITLGQKKGRENDCEFIYFNSVGLSYIDINLAYYIYKEAQKKNLGDVITLSKADTIDYSSLIF